MMMICCQFLWHMFLLTGFCSKMMGSKNMVSSVQFRWWYVVNFNGTCFNCLDFVWRWWIAKTLSVQFRWRCVVNFYGTFPLSEFCSKMTYIAKTWSVQFSPLTDWVVRGTWEMIQQGSSSSLFCRRPLWAVVAGAGVSTLWCCPSSISSVDHNVAHSPRCHEGRQWRGYYGM